MLLFSFFPLAWIMCLFVCGFFNLFLHCCFGPGKVALEKLPELILEENIMTRMQIPDGDVHAVLFQEHTAV